MLADIQFNRLMPEASARTAEQAQQLARALQDTPRLAEAVLRRHRALCMAGRAAEGKPGAAEQGWMAGHEFSAELTSDRGWVLDRLGRPQEARRWHARGCAWLARRAARWTKPWCWAMKRKACCWPANLPPPTSCWTASTHSTPGTKARTTRVTTSPSTAPLPPPSRRTTARHCNTWTARLARQASSLARHTWQIAHRAMVWAMLGQRSRALADAAEVLRHPALPPWMVSRAHTMPWRWPATSPVRAAGNARWRR